MPIATHVTGSSAILTGMPMHFAISLSSPFSNPPPPVRTIPLSIISAESSGGVFSRTLLTESIIALNGSSRASLISSEFIVMVFGRPLIRSLPLNSKVCDSTSGNALPIFIFTS